MRFGEALRFSFQALRANPVRSLLTCLGMMIGNASVILVVTISQTSQDYILEQIRGLGSNMIYAYYETGSHAETKSAADFIKQADVNVVRSELGRWQCRRGRWRRTPAGRRRGRAACRDRGARRLRRLRGA